MSRIKIAFLTFYFEAWDALADIHDLMVSDDRFEVGVFVIPRRLTGDKHFDDASSAAEFFTASGISHQLLVAEDSYAAQRQLRDWAPDYTFINYPWQRNYQPAFRAEALVEFTRICYVPYYSLPMTNEPGDIGVASHLYTQRSHQLASLIFTQDEFIRSAYAKTSRGADHVHFVGSTKLSALMSQVELGTKNVERGAKFNLVWAPHHSYSPHWLNFGVFAQMHIAMLAWVRDHPEIQVTLRPHPFLFGTLVDREVLTKNEVDEWLAAWNDLPNSSIDSSSSAAEILASADLLLTDGISFLAEYPIATDRPAIFIENSGHWQFSPIGEIAAAANVRINHFEEFAAGYEFIREAGLPDRRAEIERLRQAALPFGVGGAAPRIVEIVAADFEAGPAPLVDPNLVSETPWERQPGREPLVD